MTDMDHALTGVTVNQFIGVLRDAVANLHVVQPVELRAPLSLWLRAAEERALREGWKHLLGRPVVSVWNAARAVLAHAAAGADSTPVEEGTLMTPGQWIAQFNQAPAEHRLTAVEALLTGANDGLTCRVVNHRAQIAEAKPQVVGRLTDPASAPLGTTVVFPRWQDEHHQRQIAIRWAPPHDIDEQHPWLIVGSEGPQRLAHDNVEGCEVLSATLVYACATADLD